jgi:hypothetical protein
MLIPAIVVLMHNSDKVRSGPLIRELTGIMKNQRGPGGRCKTLACGLEVTSENIRFTSPVIGEDTHTVYQPD